MSEIKPHRLWCGYNFTALISEHIRILMNSDCYQNLLDFEVQNQENLRKLRFSGPENFQFSRNPNKPHLLRCGNTQGFLDIKNQELSKEIYNDCRV